MVGEWILTVLKKINLRKGGSAADLYCHLSQGKFHTLGTSLSNPAPVQHLSCSYTCILLTLTSVIHLVFLSRVLSTRYTHWTFCQRVPEVHCWNYVRTKSHIQWHAAARILDQPNTIINSNNAKAYHYTSSCCLDSCFFYHLMISYVLRETEGLDKSEWSE